MCTTSNQRNEVSRKNQQMKKWEGDAGLFIDGHWDVPPFCYSSHSCEYIQVGLILVLQRDETFLLSFG